MFLPAAAMFFAGRIEYIGPQFGTLAGILAGCTIIGTLAPLVLVIPMSKRLPVDALFLASGGIAGWPFLVSWLLDLNGAPINVHGFAMLSGAVYFLGSIICALGLLLTAAIRKIRS